MHSDGFSVLVATRYPLHPVYPDLVITILNFGLIHPQHAHDSMPAYPRPHAMVQHLLETAEDFFLYSVDTGIGPLRIRPVSGKRVGSHTGNRRGFGGMAGSVGHTGSRAITRAVAQRQGVAFLRGAWGEVVSDARWGSPRFCSTLSLMCQSQSAPDVLTPGARTEEYGISAARRSSSRSCACSSSAE